MKIKFVLFSCLTFFLLNSCSLKSVDGGEEGVFISKPLLFGSGGVEKTPLQSGSTWTSLTTDMVKFDIKPKTYSEDFDDMITNDHIPVDFSAHIKIKIINGKTPLIYNKFGENWYSQSIQSNFRTKVRRECSQYNMFDLSSNDEVSMKVGNILKEQMIGYVKSLKLPVVIMEVNIGKVTPPYEVLEETRRTASQNQSKLTQDARADAELSRKQAEINKAVADKAYKLEMGMTTKEYLELRALEIEKEKIEIVRDKQNVTIVMGQGLTPTVPIKQ